MEQMKWIAGYNMPGYMPETEPAVFDTDTEARAYIADCIRHHAEAMEPEELSGEDYLAMRSGADAVEAGNGEYGDTFGDYHYWISYDMVETDDDEEA